MLAINGLLRTRIFAKEKGRLPAGRSSSRKRAGAGPGLRNTQQRQPQSVFRDDRTTPTVIHADGDQIDVLADIVGARQAADVTPRPGR